MKDLLNRCSPESIRYRFHHSIKTLPEKLVDHLAQFDGSGVVTLVVIQGAGADERIIAESNRCVILRKPTTYCAISPIALS